MKQRLLAGFVLVHVIAIVAGSFPLLVDKRGMDWEKWNEPVVNREFEMWGERLGLDPERLKRGAWRASGGLNEIVYGARAPFKPYYHLCGTRQRWRMFPAPEMDPFRFEIELQNADGTWRPIFVQHDEEADWMAGQLEHDRFRAALNLYAWDVYPDGYEAFVDWVADQARWDFPDARSVRVHFRVLEGKTPKAMRSDPVLRGEWTRRTREVAL